MKTDWATIRAEAELTKASKSLSKSNYLDLAQLIKGFVESRGFQLSFNRNVRKEHKFPYYIWMSGSDFVKFGTEPGISPPCRFDCTIEWSINGSYGSWQFESTTAFAYFPHRPNYPKLNKHQVFRLLVDQFSTWPKAKINM